MTLDIGSISSAGGRSTNQDYADFLQLDNAACWVLADGLGGHRGGDVASRVAVESALASFRQDPEVSTEAVARIVRDAQAALIERQRGEPALAQMRSTLVVLVSDGRQAAWGHVGDSRLYYLQGGSIVAKTKDHSVVQALVDAGEVSPDAQAHHEDRARLLRVLGEEADLRPTILEQVQSLHRGDGFLLCSDGFWESVGDAEIELDFAGAETAEAWLSRLERRVRPRIHDGSDNFTATTIVFPADTLPPPPARVSPPIAAVAAGTGAAQHTPTRTARGRAVTALVVLAALAASGFAFRRSLVSAWGSVWNTTTAAPGDPPVVGDAPATAGAPAGADPAKPIRDYSAPSELPEGTVYRPASKDSYHSLHRAIVDAANDETIWIGPGEFREAIDPITKVLYLKGAGRETSRLNFSNGRGLVVTADDGGIEDLDLCCARSGPVLELGGTFRGTVARNRIHDGEGHGLVVTDLAAPTLSGNEVAGNRRGQMSVQGQARPAIQP